MVVTLLCGPIASGKSSYALKEAAKGSVVITDDSIVEAVHGGDYTLYKPSLKPLYKGIENSIFNLALAMGKSVVVDRGLNCCKKSRERWLSLARAVDVPCEAVVFEDFGPEVHARRRFESDSRGCSYSTWLEVARAHKSRWETPTEKEGFSEITFVKWVPKGEKSCGN